MGDLVKHLFTGFTDTITGLAGGIKDAFMNIIYVDPAAEALEVAPLFEFILIFGGVAIAMGITWKLFGLVKGKVSGR